MQKDYLKNIIAALFLVFIAVTKSLSQYVYEIDFENSNDLKRIFIDTLSNSKNIWQIGKPQKSIFITANSSPNVIVTDTMNPYAVNDTSIFIETHIVGEGFEFGDGGIISGYYCVNSDSLSDYGKIEFSPDNGKTWIDILKDTMYFPANYMNAKPVLTGNSNGWQYFNIWLAYLGDTFNMKMGDTAFYRFTFISDSIQTGKDGLMFDDLHFFDFTVAVKESQPNFPSSVFPSPAKDFITIRFENSDHQPFNLYITNLSGKNMYQQFNNSTDFFQADISNFISGAYFFKIESHNRQLNFSGSFLKIR